MWNLVIPLAGSLVKKENQLVRMLQFRSMSLIKRSDSEKSPDVKKDDVPLKFTRSAAHLDYRATDNFYGGEHKDVPRSHNIVLAMSGVSGIFYLFFLRDDIENDGGANLFKPVYETIPELAIPILQSTIAANKNHGVDTRKLEKKLAEYMQEPEKHGLKKQKLVEN